MKVGILTSWNTRCGISEYSQYLVRALQRRDDVEVTVFGSKNYDEYKVASDADYVIPTFAVLPWNKYNDHSFDVDKVLEAEVDVLHVQYEVVLYNQPPFYSLLQQFAGVKAITYHDNCIPPNLPYWRFDLQYTHREDVGVGDGFLLPMGIEVQPPTVKTFGLGRSRLDIIKEVCTELGIFCEWSFGDSEWKNQHKLYEWLRDSDAIVLYYDDNSGAGSSIAARVALSTRRPVIVSDTTWFKDLPEDEVMKVASPEELKLVLKSITEDTNYFRECSWDNIAETLVRDYEVCLQDSSNQLS